MSNQITNSDKNQLLDTFDAEYKSALGSLRLSDVIREMYMDWYTNTVACLSVIKNQTIKSKTNEIFEKLYTEVYNWHGTESQFMIARCDRILWAVESKITGSDEVHTVQYQKLISKTQNS